MKKAFITIFTLLLFGFSIYAQVTTTPEYPTDLDEITLIFDASGTPLEGYSGQMYTHTGVGIEGQGDWKHVIGNWGDNNAQPELTNLGNNKWKLLISPNIRSFYSVGASEVVYNMSFVFRSADALTQSSDIFVDVFSSELGIIITFPPVSEPNLMALENEVYTIQATSPLADSMFLFINNELVFETDQIEIDYDLVIDNVVGYWNDVPAEILAKNETGSVSETFSYIVLPEPAVEDLPGGVIDGINYIDNSTVILSLYAPGKDYVFTIGDFNNWQPGADGYMNRTQDGNRFWVQIDGLQEGEEYIFQYLVAEYGRQILIGDPYAEKVSDPWNDQSINEVTYPNMLEYPTGMTNGIATVLQTGQEPYEWQVDNFTPPAVEDMVVYELLIRDFTAQHTFQSLIDTIDYFKRLGVNVIELMPVNEFEGNLSWGYNPNYYFAVDKYYGPKNTFKAFIDECHANGIAVVIDMVLNHSFGTSPLVMLYWDTENNRPAANSPWYNPIAKHDFNVGFDFNHESPQTRAFTKRVNDFWLTEYKVDGFRFDLSKGFTQKNTLGNTGLWGQYDQTRIDIWNDYSSAIWETKPGAYIILEHFADNSEETVLSNNGMMLWGNAGHNYNEGTMGWTEDGKSDFSWISYQQRGWSQPHAVGYMESHDEERLQYKNITYGRAVGNYNIQDSTIGLQRQALAAAFFFTIPGPKMIWQFGELGYDYTIDYNGRTGEKPIRWDYLSDWRREYLFHVYAALIQLKTEYEVFATDDFTLDVHNAQKSIVLRGADMNVVVVGNFGMETANVTPAWPNVGTWYEFFTQSQYDVSATNQSVSLEHGEYRIYSTEYIEKPAWLNTSLEEISGGLNSTFGAYPNPTKGEINFSILMDSPGSVNIEIYNAMGKNVAEVDGSNLNAGINELNWNAGVNLTPGIYFAIVKAENFRSSIKFVVE
ncbi:MAG: T9SS type A sorting domain-containing protein [Bacteroidales bacterium]|nr:T9SS type A sorting domain-containing protein [Bacteroidales bacterium]